MYFAAKCQRRAHTNLQQCPATNALGVRKALGKPKRSLCRVPRWWPVTVQSAFGGTAGTVDSCASLYIAGQGYCQVVQEPDKRATEAIPLVAYRQMRPVGLGMPVSAELHRPCPATQNRAPRVICHPTNYFSQQRRCCMFGSGRSCTLPCLQSFCSSTLSSHPVTCARHAVLDHSRTKVISLTAPVAAENTAAPPSVTTLHSSQEFQDVIEQNPGRLIVMMCKAQGCRPCKMFSRKFQRLAEQFEDAVFLEIMGDETKDTRKLMIKLDVRATPTFFLYRDRRLGQTLTGINENNLRNAITDFALPNEQDKAPLE